MSIPKISAALLIVGLLMLSAGRARADEPYQFKWPWLWTTTAGVTSTPFTGEHDCGTGSCTNAFDFTISDRAVRSSTQGTVVAQVNTIMGCSTTSGGLGNFVRVATPGASDLLYGHMVAGTVVPLNTILLQADQIGVEDGTGHVDPCPQNGHLHFEWTGTRPDHVDGETTVPLQGPTSTNSIIGEYSTMGATLRSYYLVHGGWGSIGWTYGHCPGTCTLNMTANKSWGRMQDFEHDPDGFGGTFDTLHVGTYDQTHAYLVDSVFWASWAAGGAGATGGIHPLAMATQDRGACPAGSSGTCISYQHFGLGFVWMDASTGRHAVFCPDLNGDQYVNSTDMSIEATRYNMSAVPPSMDIDGNDGLVTLSDLSSMAPEYNHNCHV